MRCRLVVPVAPALAAALLLSAGAATAFSGPAIAEASVRASVDLLPAGDGKVHAVATIESRLRLRLVGVADLYVNGNQVPLGRIDTEDQVILAEPVGDETAPPTVCLVFTGTLYASDDSARAVERRDCVGDPDRNAPPLAARPILADRLPPLTRPRPQR